MWVRAYALLCLLLSVGARADAAPITVLFQGTLSGVNDPFLLSWQGNLHSGDPFSFTLQFDDATPGTPNPSTGGVEYTIPTGQTVVQVGSFGYTGSFLFIELINDDPGGGDFLNLSAGVNAGAFGSSGINIFASGNLLTSEHLADVAWPALVGQYFTLTINQFFPRPPAVVETSASGQISSITLVPEPTSVLWIAAGFVALRAQRSRRRGSKGGFE